MEKIKIVSIARNLKHSEAKNKDYTQVLIADSTGRNLSGFGNKLNENWVAGQEVEVVITKNGKYNNFSLPEKKTDNSTLEEKCRVKFAEIDKSIKSLEDYVYNVNPPKGLGLGNPNVLNNSVSPSDEATSESENLPILNGSIGVL